MYRISQEWINLNHVAHIRANLPKTEVTNPSEGSIEVTFASGEKLTIKGEWKEMKSFSAVFNPLVEALENC